MIQQYIKCFSDRPTVTRIFYLGTTHGGKATHGIVLTNTEKGRNKYTNGSRILMTERHDGIEIYN